MITSARTHTHTVRKPAALANSTTLPATHTSTSTSSSRSSSIPTTPTATSPSSNPHYSPSQLGLLTPSSSKTSLTPVHQQQHKAQLRPPSPAVTPHKTKHSSPSRHLFFPVRASLELHTHAARGSRFYMPDHASRPGSPSRRSRALSPTRPEITRPPSRCESLLRDTLRRADEQERSLARRTLSRSPGRWSRGRSRPRGNSFLEALRRDDSADSDCDCDDISTRHMVNGSEGFPRRSRAQAMPTPGCGATSTCSGDAASLMYGSPSSPTPMPPSMMRTRTAPAVSRMKGRVNDDAQWTGYSHHTPRNPTSGRQSLPNTVSRSHVSLPPSENASPQQRVGTVSPHETVLRSRLENVLQKAGSLPGEETAAPSQLTGRERRNHHRAFSHGVSVVTSAKRREGPPSYSSSPQSLAPSSLSNSASDLARTQSAHIQGHGRDTLTYRTTPSSPAEPLTPPPTPPFDARSASEFCKRVDGYVSFAEIEGLGEPPGLDIDSDESEDGLKKLGRWFRTLPISFLNGAPGSSTQEAGQLTVTRERAGSH